jgi:capsular polysaccharide export protein
MSILFVGAPFGRFFRYLAPALEGRGITVWRTVCDGGEFIATPAANRVVYRGSPDGFRAFLRRTMIERRVTTVVTFNDMCPRARAAHAVASDLRIGRRVLEEGYLRPWWVTFDHEGVNGNTLLPKDPEFYLRAARPPVPHRTFKHTFRYLVRDTITHFAACTLMSCPTTRAITATASGGRHAATQASTYGGKPIASGRCCGRCARDMPWAPASS